MCGRNIGAIFSGPRPCLCPPSPAGSTLRPTAAPYGSPPTAICLPRVMPGCASPACPAAILLILLVDERPEEVSEMVDWGRGEVIASSFDLSHERHVAVADMVFEHARRQVELGKDVVIVLDSLTRLARSHNTTGRGSG